MKTIEIKLDDELYQEATELYEALGLNIETAVSIFLHQSILRQGLPFKVRLPKPEAPMTEPIMENPIINDLNF